MPEDLPVTKWINVIVGITRSKVIFIFASRPHGRTLCNFCWRPVAHSWSSSCRPASGMDMFSLETYYMFQVDRFLSRRRWWTITSFCVFQAHWSALQWWIQSSSRAAQLVHSVLSVLVCFKFWLDIHCLSMWLPMSRRFWFWTTLHFALWTCIHWTLFLFSELRCIAYIETHYYDDSDLCWHTGFLTYVCAEVYVNELIM